MRAFGCFHPRLATSVAMPLTNVAKEIYCLALQNGVGENDSFAICHYLPKQRRAAI